MKLLVNNHETDNSKAAIFLYEVPSDLFKGQYPRKVIASGFVNAFSVFIPNMCPGFLYPVTPKTGAKTHILVAGDGDYSAHLLRPDGQGGFNRDLIKNLGGTVGSIATYDFNNDGFIEFFVANYDNNYIDVYQFYDGPVIQAEVDVNQVALCNQECSNDYRKCLVHTFEMQKCMQNQAVCGKDCNKTT